MQEVVIKDEFIKLGQVLKLAGLVDSDFIMIDNRMIPIRKSGRKLIVKRYEDFLKDSLEK